MRTGKLNGPTALARAAALLLLAGWWGSAAPEDVPRSSDPAAVVWEADDRRIRAVLVADGLVWPWDIAFLPDGDAMLVTEAPGRLRIARDDILAPAPVWQAPSPDGNDVLHGVVVHPDFARNRYVYVSYVTDGRKGVSLAIARGRLEHDVLVDVREIFVADAWTDALHNTAGRMAFGPDGSLFVSVGDRDRLWRTDDDRHRLRAQALGDHVGKILRLTDEGGIPDDNPFVGRRGARPEIYAYGFRNGYGLAFHPDSGELWQADIGPLGGDEINVIRPGGNYGWPLVSAGRHYSGTPVSSAGEADGVEPPLLTWVPAITPSSITFYRGDTFPDWKGSLFVSALSGRRLERLTFGDDGEVREREPLLDGLGLRFRVVAQGPDGALYAATERRYGSGEPDGTLLRLEPY